MLSQIAQVFSSNGVVLPGTEYVPVRGRAEAGKLPECGHGVGCKCGKTRFEQDSAKVELSKQGRALDAAAKKNAEQGADGKPLSDDERKQVEALKKRDVEVRRHESQHQAAGGGYTGGASYEYENGPDGKAYAVGGHVNIDASPVSGNPQATLAKARVVQQAALAPADPSGQDRAVAAAAAQMAMEARSEMDRSQGSQGASAGSPGAASEPPTDVAENAQGNTEVNLPPAPAGNAAATLGYARAAAVPKGARFSAYA